MTIIGWP
ncbi:hypothetical protein SCA6_017238 [Theobroma cacao]